MKRIISLVLVVVLSLACLVACGGGDSEYTLSIAVDDGFKTVNTSGNGTCIAVAIVADEDGKIVAARFDSVQVKNTATDAAKVATKVELGDSYTGMNAGSWAKQAKAFEDFLVGKTAEEVAALDTSAANVSSGALVAGCTMVNTTPIFQALVAKAAAYERKVTFATSEDITLGFAINAKVSGGKISADFAAVALAGDKVAASMLDYAEAKAGAEYAGTKNEQGDAYDPNNVMKAGKWYAQAQAYANTAAGKTVAELANLSSEAVAGCTMMSSIPGFKTVLPLAASYAR